MKKVKKVIRSNYKIFIGVLIGLIISLGGVYAATTIAGSAVTYSNTTTGLSSTTVQGAIDELYTKSDIRNADKFVAVYKYSTATSTKCITGEESTCVKSTCYKTKTSGSCPAGTIIKYKVNDTTIVNFHVMFDKGTTMIMQSQRNLANNVSWITKGDYEDSTLSGTCDYTYGTCTNKGPLTAITLLEKVTSTWTNVDEQTYTMGKTNDRYTQCSGEANCNENSYTWESRKGKARMITFQEAITLGCTQDEKSCPIWMFNYLVDSTKYGGTVNDNGSHHYLTMNTSGYYTAAWGIQKNGILYYAAGNGGIRPVVVVSK